MIRLTVHFTGGVQGVGFRFTTANVARSFNVAGYVKNLPDGRVECVAEGERGEVLRFIADVEQAMDHHITHVTKTESAAMGEFNAFGVRR